MAGAIVAGIAADLDAVSARFGPSAFLQWHRTYLHSVSAAVLVAIVVSLAVLLLVRQQRNRQQNKDAFATILPGAPPSVPEGGSSPSVLFAALGASLLHVLMDFCQNERVKLLWPFRAERYSADLVAHFDLWMLLILLAGVLLPQLFALVTEEIGAKSKAPRGRIGATLALVAVSIYVGGRFVLHGNALAMLESRTYRREPARKIAALAESDSPLHWRGIVETERALHDLEVNLGAGAKFDPDSGFVSYKPEPSPPLEAAEKTDVARRFLQFARFPKASVEKTATGYRIEIREFLFQRNPRVKHVMAVVETGPDASVTDQELVWETLAK